MGAFIFLLHLPQHVASTSRSHYCVIAPTFTSGCKPERAQAEGQRGGGSPLDQLPLKSLPGIPMQYFLLYPIGQTVVIRPNVAAKQPKGCSLKSSDSCYWGCWYTQEGENGTEALLYYKFFSQHRVIYTRKQQSGPRSSEKSWFRPLGAWCKILCSIVKSTK